MNTEANLITPQEVPRWVPGIVTDASDQLGWRNVTLRGYQYHGQDVVIPPVRDYMIVSYQNGGTPMERRFEGQWTKTTCRPGSVSLLTRAQQSHWHWSQNVEVSHIYLTDDLIREVGGEAFGHAIDDVRLHDVLNVEDQTITAAVAAIRNECHGQALGGNLYVESIGTQLALHLLRNYASVSLEDRHDRSRFTKVQSSNVLEFIECNLGERIDLTTLAAVAGLGLCAFSRRFKATFGVPAYAFVTNRRVLKARKLVESTAAPLKQIAIACGFTDQAHLTRAFKACHGKTPGALRKENLGRAPNKSEV
ncbi:MAG: AraC family transcriptional regulator [Pseudomonadota bacterium]